MFRSLWRHVRGGDAPPRDGKSRRRGRLPSYRPVLEPLEDRTLPALGAPLPAVGITTPPKVALATPSAVSGLRPISPTSSALTNVLRVTVTENACPTVLDLGPVFAAVSGLQHEDGLQFAMLGNTNAGLVKTSLSKTQLTLSYAPGKCGTATLTVGATDADGVCARETVLVTVLPPPKPADTVAGVSPAART